MIWDASVEVDADAGAAEAGAMPRPKVAESAMVAAAASVPARRRRREDRVEGVVDGLVMVLRSRVELETKEPVHPPWTRLHRQSSRPAARNFEGREPLPVDLAANARSYGVDVIEVAPG
ncbi:hypothetical protein, partial [Clavibacter michiganensis]|uniref:hypothetical protein n=1 Tax=Clavibacter michiganensis TaxID=28447 RepID=UPI00292FED01